MDAQTQVSSSRGRPARGVHLLLVTLLVLVGGATWFVFRQAPSAKFSEFASFKPRAKEVHANAADLYASADAPPQLNEGLREMDLHFVVLAFDQGADELLPAMNRQFKLKDGWKVTPAPRKDDGFFVVFQRIDHAGTAEFPDSEWAALCGAEEAANYADGLPALGSLPEGQTYLLYRKASRKLDVKLREKVSGGRP